MNVETGCLIDNTSGVYSPDEIIDRLADFARKVGVPSMEVAELIGDIYEGVASGEITSEDLPQVEYETEVEIIDKINDVLSERGLVLTVGEVNPGDYLIEAVA